MFSADKALSEGNSEPCNESTVMWNPECDINDESKIVEIIKTVLVEEINKQKTPQINIINNTEYPLVSSVTGKDKITITLTIGEPMSAEELAEETITKFDSEGV